MEYAFWNRGDLPKIEKIMEYFQKVTRIHFSIVSQDKEWSFRTDSPALHGVDCRYDASSEDSRFRDEGYGQMKNRCGLAVEGSKWGLYEVSHLILIKDRHVATIHAGPFFMESDNIPLHHGSAPHFQEVPFSGENHSIENYPVVDKHLIDAFLGYFSCFLSFCTEKGGGSWEEGFSGVKNQDYIFFFKELIDTIPNPLFYKNEHGVYEWSNRAFEYLVGMKKGEIVGSECENISFCSLLKAEKGYSDRFYSRVGTVVYETLLNYPESSEMEAIVTETPHIDMDGIVKGTLGIIHDISDRKVAENALRQSEERFRTLVDSNIDAILVIDKKGGLRFCNRAAKALFKWKDEKTDSVIAGIPTSRYGSTVIQILDENGGIKHAEMRHVNTLWEGEDAYLVTLRDISQQIAMQHERQKLERQLRRAQKMEAIGTLAGGIAHDFNNILSAVMGYTEIGIDDLEDGTQIKRNMFQVLTAARRAKELVRQILTFSRQVDHEYTEVQVNLIVKEALKLLRASIPSTVEIIPRIMSESKIYADPTQIHQVLMNLCTNANHAMQEKGGTLEVLLEERLLDGHFVKQHIGMVSGNHICLTVRDTGHGMPAEVLERIFDPFFTTKKKGEGTGMGLAVVHGIVRSHGGAITVESELSKGTTFHLYFPIIDAKQSGKGEGYEEAAEKGHERILFVDDEPLIVNYAKQMLNRLGYSVVTRTNSTEALELFRERPMEFDMVITDLTMPNMTGDELAREILGIRESVPIILCTGFSSKISEKDAKKLGVRAFLNKPIVRHQLSKTIRSVLDERL